MPIKDIWEITSKHPTIAAATLFAMLAIGAFGGVLYTKTSEQRIALMEERLKNQESITSRHRNAITAIQSEFGGLRVGVRNLTKKIITAKSIASRPNKKGANPSLEKDSMLLAITELEKEAATLEKVITDSESVTKAFSQLLTSNQLGTEFITREFFASFDPEEKARSIRDLSANLLQVNKKELRPGDFVTLKSRLSTVDQEAIYLGGSKVVKLPASRGTLEVKDFDHPNSELSFYEAVRPPNSDLAEELAKLYAQEAARKSRSAATANDRSSRRSEKMLIN